MGEGVGMGCGAWDGVNDLSFDRCKRWSLKGNLTRTDLVLRHQILKERGVAAGRQGGEPHS